MVTFSRPRHKVISIGTRELLISPLPIVVMMLISDFSSFPATVERAAQFHLLASYMR